MIVFTDFHHNSLLTSLHMLFVKRLGWKLYRPYGMEWFDEGFWAINDSPATARQFLEINFTDIADKTPPLNEVMKTDAGIVEIYDPGRMSSHLAINLETFKSIKVDIVIASIPQHIPLFQRLIKEYQPQAKLVVQIGNNWPVSFYEGHNVMASVMPFTPPPNTNVIFYHQEFDLGIFKYTEPFMTRRIHSFLNVLQNHRIGYQDFLTMEKLLEGRFVTMKSYGGQCRDGNLAGPQEIYESMCIADMIFHSKDGGDGYGHILHNAAAAGKVVITRESFYKDCLGSVLLKPGDYINLDGKAHHESADEIMRLFTNKDKLIEMGQRFHRNFVDNVSFEYSGELVRLWIESL